MKDKIFAYGLFMDNILDNGLFVDMDIYIHIIHIIHIIITT